MKGGPSIFPRSCFPNAHLLIHSQVCAFTVDSRVVAVQLLEGEADVFAPVEKAEADLALHHGVEARAALVGSE